MKTSKNNKTILKYEIVKDQKISTLVLYKENDNQFKLVVNNNFGDCAKYPSINYFLKCMNSGLYDLIFTNNLKVGFEKYPTAITYASPEMIANIQSSKIKIPSYLLKKYLNSFIN